MEKYPEREYENAHRHEMIYKHKVYEFELKKGDRKNFWWKCSTCHVVTEEEKQAIKKSDPTMNPHNSSEEKPKLSMRDRKDIEEGTLCKGSSGGMYQMESVESRILEVLLDIRELLEKLTTPKIGEGIYK